MLHRDRARTLEQSFTGSQSTRAVYKGTHVWEGSLSHVPRSLLCVQTGQGGGAVPALGAHTGHAEGQITPTTVGLLLSAATQGPP